MIKNNLVVRALVFCMGCLSLFVGRTQQCAAELIRQDPPLEARIFVQAPASEFQWWVDPRNQRMNFRRCDYVREKHRIICQAPMLFDGIPLDDVPTLLNYYAERLNIAGNANLSEFVQILSGSLGTATAYIGGVTALNVFKDNLPSFLTRFSSFRGIHLVGVGTVTLLLYFSGKKLIHVHRQGQVLHLFRRAVANNPKVPPEVRLNSKALFEEFTLTFRRTLYEFTHGGPPFADEGNLVFQ